MSSGSAKRSQSTIDLFTRSGDVDKHIEQGSAKRNRQEILINITDTNNNLVSSNSNNSLTSASVNTIVEERTPRDTAYPIVKLDRLVEKKNKYTVHQEFLEKCIQEKVIPQGLKIVLEPSIGNHDEAFLKKWKGRMEEFSLTIMNDIKEFCEETQTKVTEDINQLQTNINTSFDPVDRKTITETINSNEKSRLRNLRRSKQGKFNFISHGYKPRMTNQNQSANASSDQRWANQRQSANANNDHRNTQNRTRETSGNRKWSEVVKETRTPTVSRRQSKTNVPAGMDKKIDLLQIELNKLKRTTNHEQRTTNNESVESNQHSNRNNGNSKNFLEAPGPRRGAQLSNQTDKIVVEALTFIKGTMEKLTAFERLLSQSRHTDPTLSDM